MHKVWVAISDSRRQCKSIAVLSMRNGKSKSPFSPALATTVIATAVLCPQQHSTLSSSARALSASANGLTATESYCCTRLRKFRRML